MNDDKTKVLDAIEEMVETQTLSLTAIEAVQELRKDHAYLVGIHETLVEHLDACKEDAIKAQATIIGLEHQVEEFRDREKASSQRRRELDRKMAQVDGRLESQDHFNETLRIIFRSPVIKREVYGSRDVPAGADGYGKQQMQNNTTEMETTE